MLKRFYLLLTILSTLTAVAQASRRSGILPGRQVVPPEKAEKSTDDTAQVNRLIKQAEGHYESAPDSTIIYGKLADRMARRINYKKGSADGLVQIAKVYSFNGKYKASDSVYRAALKIYKSEKLALGESEVYMGLGSIKDYLGDYTAALWHYDNALNIRIKLGNQLEIANCYAIIGITYDNMGQFTKALDNYFQSLKIDLKLNNQLAAADNYCNIGVVMQHLELWDKALTYFQKAQTLWVRLNDKQGISTISQNIGEVLMSNKRYKEAVFDFKKALKVYLELGDQDGISLVYYDLGMVNYYMSRPDSAMFYLNKGLASARKNNIKYNAAYAYEGLATVYNFQQRYQEAYTAARSAQLLAKSLQSINLQAESALQVSKALAGLRNYSAAYQEHDWYSTLQDSLKNGETLQRFASYNLAVEFEEAQKKAEAKEAVLTKKLKTQRTTNYIYSIVIVITLIMLVIYYNAKRKQIKANAMLAEKNKEISTQAEELNGLNVLKDRLISILAHDLRAPLSTLRGMFSLLTEKDITHSEFIEMVPSVFSKLEHTSDFLDTLLFWINSQVDNVQDTIKSFCLNDVVKTELEVLQDQFKNKDITARNCVDPGHLVVADPNSIRIVVHNFLTNAIKFSHEGSTIELNAYVKDNSVCFTVKDTGIGMTADQLQKLFKRKVESHAGTRNERGTGMGLIFCKDLVEKYSGNIWAVSHPNEGTELGFSLAADKSRVNVEAVPA